MQEDAVSVIVHEDGDVEEGSVDEDALESSVDFGSEFVREYEGSPIELTVIAGRGDGNPGGAGPGGYTPGEPIPKRPNPALISGGQNCFFCFISISR